MMKHKMEAGETYAKLAKKYYGDPALWPNIELQNPQIIDPRKIVSGTIINIPDKKDIDINNREISDTEL